MLHDFSVIFRDMCRFRTETLRGGCGLEAYGFGAGAGRISQIPADAGRVHLRVRGRSGQKSSPVQDFSRHLVVQFCCWINK